jgi:predicted nucleic-acid-binding protein
MSVKQVHLDANVLLRFLRNDDAEQSPLAARLFNRAQSKEVQLLVSPVILLEVFHVLAGAYSMPRPQAAQILLMLVTSKLVQCENVVVTTDALQRITSQKISFGDAYLAASAVHTGVSVASFDRHLSEFKDVALYDLSKKA